MDALSNTSAHYDVIAGVTVRALESAGAVSISYESRSRTTSARSGEQSWPPVQLRTLRIRLSASRKPTPIRLRVNRKTQLILGSSPSSPARRRRGPSDSPQRKTRQPLARERVFFAALLVSVCATVSVRAGKVIEAVECSVGGDKVQAILCGCERCRYLWLVPMERGTPARCSRCKSRTWAGSAAPEVEQPVAVPPVPAPTEPDRIPAGVRCPRCGLDCTNSFGLAMHCCADKELLP